VIGGGNNVAVAQRKALQERTAILTGMRIDPSTKAVYASGAKAFVRFAIFYGFLHKYCQQKIELSLHFWHFNLKPVMRKH
jgi:hypothetical protein